VEAGSARPGAYPIQIGYAHCSTAQQELQSLLGAPARAECKQVFSEKISTQFKTRPELEQALKLAYDIREAARTSRLPSPFTSSSASQATPPS